MDLPSDFSPVVGVRPSVTHVSQQQVGPGIRRALTCRLEGEPPPRRAGAQTSKHDNWLAGRAPRLAEHVQPPTVPVRVHHRRGDAVPVHRGHRPRDRRDLVLRGSTRTSNWTTSRRRCGARRPSWRARAGSTPPGRRTNSCVSCRGRRAVVHAIAGLPGQHGRPGPRSLTVRTLPGTTAGPLSPGRSATVAAHPSRRCVP